jgi:hydroxylamine reductase
MDLECNNSGCIGPKPPEFISEGVMNVLTETFGLKLIGTAAEDMKEMLQFSDVE